MQRGEAALGCFFRSNDSDLLEYVANLGWDFIVLDGEHGKLAGPQLGDHVRSCEVCGVPAIYRTIGPQAKDIGAALDSGVIGIQIPNIRSARDVSVSSSMLSYPSDGTRGLAPVRSNRWDITKRSSASPESRSPHILVCHVENLSIVAELDELLHNELIDVVYLGGADLAGSMQREGPWDTDVRELMVDVGQRILAAGKILGVNASSAADIKEWRALGARYITTSLETVLMIGQKAIIEPGSSARPQAS